MSIKQNFPEVSPSLLLDFANSKTLDPTITFTRASVGTYVGCDGLIKTASNNEPRFDHDPTTGESLGLLIEESRTNLVEYGDFTTGWAEYGGTATSTTATTAPDGTFTAKKITSKGDVATSGIYDSIQYSANTTYTHTMWLKAGTVTIAGITVNSAGKWSDYPYITVNLSTGAVTASGGVSAKATAYPNGWYRLEAIGTFAGNTQVDAIWVHSQSGSMSGDTTSYYYVWGPQAEQSALGVTGESFATSYIPTSGSTVTRAADTAQITGTNFTDFYNQEEGTLLSSSHTLGVDLYQTATFEFTSSNSNAERIALEVTNSYNRFSVYGGGGSGTNYTSGVVPAGTLTKNALAYKLNDVAGVRDGGTVLNDTSVGIPIPNIDRANIGYNLNYGNQKQQHIARLSYYPKRLTDAQLQNLTK